MSKHRTITVSSHVRRAPVRTVIVGSPANAIEDPKPLLPCPTSPTQCAEYGWPMEGGRYDRETGVREYSDTIADRFMGSDDDRDGEY